MLLPTNLVAAVPENEMLLFCGGEHSKVKTRIKRENIDTAVQKCIVNNEKRLAFNTNEKLQALKLHYDKFLNEEFCQSADLLSEERSV